VRDQVWQLSTALSFLMLAGAAQASPILDQNNPPSGNLGLNDQLEFQQQVTDGIAGVLAGVTLFTKSGSDTDTVKIGVGSAFSTGPFAFTTTSTITTAGTFIDTSAANISLTAGEHFVIDVSGNPSNPGNGGLAGSASPYAGGDLYLFLGAPIDETSSAGESMAFETFITVVPEPASLILFGIGLASLGLVHRRNRSSTDPAHCV